MARRKVRTSSAVRKDFRNTANRLHVKNVASYGMRGGIRL